TETGTRDLRRLGGLRRVMPITATLAIISSAAMAGVPLLNGFLSKEMFFAVALDTQHSLWLDTITIVLAVAAAALSVTYSVRLVAEVFFGRLPGDLPRTPQEPPHSMRFPIGMLALACLTVGMRPAWAIGAPLHGAAVAVLGARLPTYSLAIWHGWNAPLLLSGMALFGGCSLYVLLRRRIMGDDTPVVGHVSAWRAFEHLLAFLTTTLPRAQRRLFPERRLQIQLLVLVLVATMLTLAASRHLAWPLLPPRSTFDPGFALLWLLGGCCAVGAATQAKFHRLAALTLSGAVGLVVCITFVWLSAPDLAATQLVVETVTTILILLGLRWLPRRIQFEEPATVRARFRRRRDLLVAIGVGAGVAALAFVTMLTPVADSVSQFYLQQAESGAGGRNVVNVILVDFRALD